MSNATLEQLLDQVEQQFNVASAALIDGDLEGVQSSTAALQQSAVNFVLLADEVGRNQLTQPHVALRIKALALAIPALRENLLRRGAYVERALQLVVPETQKSTYASVTGPYGNGVRQSGRVKPLIA